MTEPLTGLDEAIEAAARALYELEYPRPGGHPDSHRWSWLGDGHSDELKDVFRGQARTVAPVITAAVRADERTKVLDDWADLAYDAWCVIANSGAFGNPPDPSEGFPEAAVRWRDRYHALLAETRRDDA